MSHFLETAAVVDGWPEESCIRFIFFFWKFVMAKPFVRQIPWLGRLVFLFVSPSLSVQLSVHLSVYPSSCLYSFEGSFNCFRISLSFLVFCIVTAASNERPTTNNNKIYFLFPLLLYLYFLLLFYLWEIFRL